jgi:hypothetical protein
MTTLGETATGRSLPPVGIELGHGKPGGGAKEAVVAIVHAGRTISDEETERSIESWRKG